MLNEQEKFWKSDFGNKYTNRYIKKESSKFFTTKIKMWRNVLPLTPNIKSVFEIGTNTGFNLDVIKRLTKNKKLSTNGIEINRKAYLVARKNHNIKNISVLNYLPKEKYDLTMSCGVLIHIHPSKLKLAYKVLYESSKKYIIICEYFSHQPMEVKYRGFQNKLFKRDFAKEIKNLYNLKLIDYKFMWSEDSIFPCDNTTWFLFKKTK